MYNFLTKNGQLLSFGFGALLVVLFYLIASTGVAEFDLMSKEDQFQTSIFNFGLMAAIVLIIIAAAAAILFSIFHVAKNPKGALKGLIGIVGLIVIFVIIYAMADGTVKATWVENFGITESISKYVSAALSTAIVLGLITIAAFVFGEVRNLFK